MGWISLVYGPIPHHYMPWKEAHRDLYSFLIVYKDIVSAITWSTLGEFSMCLSLAPCQASALPDTHTLETAVGQKKLSCGSREEVSASSHLIQQARCRTGCSVSSEALRFPLLHPANSSNFFQVQD